jgi:fructokinase
VRDDGGERDRLCLGVDLGGTKIEAAVVRLSADDSWTMLARERTETPQAKGYEAVVAATADHVRTVLAAAGVALADVGVGVGLPGSVTRDGTTKNCNVTCLNGRPFRHDLERALGLRVVFDNDANCFALAEARLGAGRSVEGIVLGIIIGSGVGAGLVIDGRVWPGLQGVAGEWGHHPVFHAPAPEERAALRSCYCGARGCVEAYVSGRAVEADYAARTGTRRPLAQIAARRAHDAAAREVVETFLHAFARGLANVVDILDPSLIVVGGGVSNLDLLYDEGAARMQELVFTDRCETRVVRHALGDSAGVLGAALMAAR